MEDQELLKIVKKNRQKRFLKSTGLNLFLVLAVLSGILLGVGKYFNYGLFAGDAKVAGLPNEQLRYQYTSFSEISTLFYTTSGSYAFNHYGKNANLKMTVYQYGKKTHEEIIGPSQEDGEKRNLAGYVTLGLRNGDSTEEFPDGIVDYAIIISGASNRGTIKASDYGLEKNNGITAYSMGVGGFNPNVKSTLFSKERYTFKTNNEIPLLTMGGDEMKFGAAPYEEFYADTPWVMMITLEFF